MHRDGLPIYREKNTTASGALFGLATFDNRERMKGIAGSIDDLSARFLFPKTKDENHKMIRTPLAKFHRKVAVNGNHEPFNCVVATENKTQMTCTPYVETATRKNQSCAVKPSDKVCPGFTLIDYPYWESQLDESEAYLQLAVLTGRVPPAYDTSEEQRARWFGRKKDTDGDGKPDTHVTGMRDKYIARIDPELVIFKYDVSQVQEDQRVMLNDLATSFNAVLSEGMSIDLNYDGMVDETDLTIFPHMARIELTQTHFKIYIKLKEFSELFYERPGNGGLGGFADGNEKRLAEKMKRTGPVMIFLGVLATGVIDVTEEGRLYKLGSSLAQKYIVGSSLTAGSNATMTVEAAVAAGIGSRVTGFGPWLVSGLGLVIRTAIPVLVFGYYTTVVTLNFLEIYNGQMSPRQIDRAWGQALGNSYLMVVAGVSAVAGVLGALTATASITAAAVFCKVFLMITLPITLVWGTYFLVDDENSWEDYAGWAYDYVTRPGSIIHGDNQYLDAARSPWGSCVLHGLGCDPSKLDSADKYTKGEDYGPIILPKELKRRQETYAKAMALGVSAAKNIEHIGSIKMANATLSRMKEVRSLAEKGLAQLDQLYDEPSTALTRKGMDGIGGYLHAWINFDEARILEGSERLTINAEIASAHFLAEQNPRSEALGLMFDINRDMEVLGDEGSSPSFSDNLDAYAAIVAEELPSVGDGSRVRQVLQATERALKNLDKFLDLVDQNTELSTLAINKQLGTSFEEVETYLNHWTEYCTDYAAFNELEGFVCTLSVPHWVVDALAADSPQGWEVASRDEEDLRREEQSSLAVTTLNGVLAKLSAISGSDVFGDDGQNYAYLLDLAEVINQMNRLNAKDQKETPEVRLAAMNSAEDLVGRLALALDESQAIYTGYVQKANQYRMDFLFNWLSYAGAPESYSPLIAPSFWRHKMGFQGVNVNAWSRADREEMFKAFQENFYRDFRYQEFNDQLDRAAVCMNGTEILPISMVKGELVSKVESLGACGTSAVGGSVFLLEAFSRVRGRIEWMKLLKTPEEIAEEGIAGEIPEEAVYPPDFIAGLSRLEARLNESSAADSARKVVESGAKPMRGTPAWDKLITWGITRELAVKASGGAY
jgi:hypothetical protein